MSDHSPGPWSYGKCGATDPATGKVRETDNYAAVDGGEGYIVATVWGHSLPGPTVLANARLIAAGPDMLDVLKHIHDQITYLQESYGTDGFPEIVARRVREVIARAEGTTP